MVNVDENLGFDLFYICNSEFVEVINQKHNQCDFCFCQAPGLDKHKSLQNGGLSAPLANAACKAFAEESLSNAVPIFWTLKRDAVAVYRDN